MVLLIVDTQKLITNHQLYAFDLFAANMKALIHYAREYGIEVVYVRHDDGEKEALTKGTQGFEIYEEFQPLENEKILDKTVNSTFRKTALLTYLKEKGNRSYHSWLTNRFLY